MRMRKKEMDTLLDLLSKDYSDVEDLADDVWKAIDQARRERDLFVVGVNFAGVGQFLFGPYDTLAAAESDLSGKGSVRGIGPDDTARIFKVLSPSVYKARVGDEQGALFDTR